MPFKSKSQIRKFFIMEEQGRLPKGTIKRWIKETRNIKNLPERSYRKIKRR